MFLIQSKLLSSVPNLSHGFIGPDDASSMADNLSFNAGREEDVREARRRAAGLLGVEAEKLTFVYQEHGDLIHPVSSEQAGAGALAANAQLCKGDGMMTAQPGAALAILTADCIPVMLAAEDGSAIAIAHAGWRGTLKAIAKKTADRMNEEFGIDPAKLKAWIGPGISFDYFEVGEDTWAYFIDGWCQYHDCFDAKNRCIDLHGLNYYQLIEAGLLEDNIEISEDCTVGDERFYSYRRQGEGYGRNMAAIAIR
ncbi:MAG: hypothetical protein GC154_10175 [bacterium]|nr:hypothetical protein [bacterium]